MKNTVAKSGRNRYDKEKPQLGEETVMKIAILLDEDNFRRYAAPEKLPPEFELRSFGNGEPDE